MFRWPKRSVTAGLSSRRFLIASWVSGGMVMGVAVGAGEGEADVAGVAVASGPAVAEGPAGLAVALAGGLEVGAGTCDVAGCAAPCTVCAMTWALLCRLWSTLVSI